jgi:hypothetical protein
MVGTKRRSPQTNKPHPKIMNNEILQKISNLPLREYLLLIAILSEFAARPEVKGLMKFAHLSFGFELTPALEAVLEALPARPSRAVAAEMVRDIARGLPTSKAPKARATSEPIFWAEDPVIQKFRSLQITGVRILLKECGIERRGNTITLHSTSRHLTTALRLGPLNLGEELGLKVQIAEPLKHR